MNTMSACVVTLVIFVLQLLIISNRFKNIRVYNSDDLWVPEPKPNDLVFLFSFLSSLSLVFNILFLIFGFIKIGNFSHDSVIIGKELDIVSKNVSNSLKLSNQKIHQKKTSLMPPLSQLFHILSAFFLLFGELSISKRLIEIKSRPLGDSFATRLDFIFGSALTRIKLGENLTITNDDFSFNSDMLLSVDTLNLILAVFIFSIKAFQTFWYTNRAMGLIFAAFSLNFAIQTLSSYCTFEIIYKSKVFGVILNQMILKDNILLFIIFFTSLALVIVNYLTIIRLAFSKFELHAFKFQLKLFRMYHHEKKDSKSEETKFNEVSFSPLILSSVLFVAYCIIRSLFIYDSFVVYKYSHDALVLISIISEFLALFSWIALILIFNIKKTWVFRLDDSFKLLNWSRITSSGSKKCLSNNLNGLLVRDDSTLNGSASSITEISFMNGAVSASVDSQKQVMFDPESLYSKPQRLVNKTKGNSDSNTSYSSSNSCNNSDNDYKTIYESEIQRNHYSRATYSSERSIPHLNILHSVNYKMNSVAAKDHKHVQHYDEQKKRVKVMLTADQVANDDSGRDSLNESPVSQSNLAKAAVLPTRVKKQQVPDSKC